jgi:hypothetical protein
MPAQFSKTSTGIALTELDNCYPECYVGFPAGL